jgi:hypothetical protein
VGLSPTEYASLELDTHLTHKIAVWQGYGLFRFVSCNYHQLKNLTDLEFNSGSQPEQRATASVERPNPNETSWLQLIQQ